jgi:hypothetical protein
MSSLLLLILLMLNKQDRKGSDYSAGGERSVESLVMPERHLFSPSMEVKHHEINKPDFGFS